VELVIIFTELIKVVLGIIFRHLGLDLYFSLSHE
jgi:hypothetical protein